MSLEHLEFLLDLDAKVDGAVKLLGVLDRSMASLHMMEIETAKAITKLGKLDQQSDHAGKTHAKHAQHALNLGHAFDNAKDKAHGLLEAMGLILVFEGVERLVDKFKELGEEIIHAAASAQRSEAAFKLTVGDEQGDRVIEWIEKVKNLTEFTKPELLGFAQDLARVGMKTDDIFKALIASMDMAARSKKGIDGMAGAVEAFARMERTGKMNNRFLGGLGFGEKDFRQLERFAHMSKATFKKQFEEGGLSKDELFQLMFKTTGKPIGSLDLALGKGMSATLTHLGEAPEAIFEKMAKSPGFEKLNLILKDLTERLDPKGPLGGKIVENLSVALTNFSDVLAKIDMDKFSKGVLTLFEKLPPLIEQTTKALVELVKVMGRFTGITGPGAVGAGGHKLSDAALDTIPGTKKSIELSPEQQMGVAKFQNWMHKWLHIGSGASESMANGLLEGSPDVEAAGAHVGKAGEAGLKTSLKIHSPSKVFEDLGLMSGEGFLQGLDASMAQMPDSVPTGAFARPAGGSPSGPIQVSVHVETHVNAGGGGHADADQIGQQVAAAVEAILPGALQSAFQRMQQEAGS